jgi:hypothetical protein
MAFIISVNGVSVSVDAPAVTPQLWVIREDLKVPRPNLFGSPRFWRIQPGDSTRS